MNREIFENTRNFWGKQASKGNLLWPNENVIRFVKRNYKDPDSTILLDYGCGGGRDTYALCVEGYKVIAMDYAEGVLNLVREKCKAFPDDQVSIVKNEALEVPLQDCSVDGIIADGSLFYNTKEDITEVMTNLRRVLKKGGLLWTNFRTTEDYLYGMGEKIDENLFRLDERTGREGSTYYFANEEDIRTIFEDAGMEIISIDDYSYSENNHQIVNRWYHVIARKADHQ